MTTEIPFAQLEQQLREGREEWERLFVELLRPVEQLLLRLQRERFDRLSRGETVNNTRWAPAQRVVAQMIGIRSRNLQDSLRSRGSFGKGRLKVRLRYEAAYAGAFDKLRKLLPKRIPQEWAEPIRALMEQQLAKLEERLKARGLID